MVFGIVMVGIVSGLLFFIVGYGVGRKDVDKEIKQRHRVEESYDAFVKKTNEEKRNK